MIIQRQIIRK